MSDDDQLVSIFRGNQIITGSDHTYAIGGNAWPLFVLGHVGREADFYLIGAAPDLKAEGLPMISANLFDRDGKHLCRIVRNTIAHDVGGVSKTYGSARGYEILDRLGHLVMRVSTEFSGTLGDPGSFWRTVIEGNFYDAAGRLIVRAEANGMGGMEVGEIPMFIPGVITRHMNPDEVFMAAVAIDTRGAITRLRKDEIIEDEAINIDGLVIAGGRMLGCQVQIPSGHFRLTGGVYVEGCTWSFVGEALNVAELALMVAEGELSPDAAAEVAAVRRRMTGR